MPEKEVTRIKRVEIAELSAGVKVALYEHFCASYSGPPPRPAPAPPARRERRGAPRMLANLLHARRRPAPECRVEPLVLREPEKPVRPSGAKKRKMGRRYGGAAFWPCGR